MAKIPLDSHELLGVKLKPRQWQFISNALALVGYLSHGRMDLVVKIKSELDAEMELMGPEGWKGIKGEMERIMDQLATKAKVPDQTNPMKDRLN